MHGRFRLCACGLGPGLLLGMVWIPLGFVSYRVHFSGPLSNRIKAFILNNLHLDLTFSLHPTLKAFESSRSHAI